MALIKGIDVVLVGKTQTGIDDFGSPIFEDKEVVVKNVLVVPTSTDDVTNSLNLTGKKAEYTLGIPKGDENVWENKEVIFFNKRWKTIGIPQQGIESLVPLNWHKKVQVERYE